MPHKFLFALIAMILLLCATASADAVKKRFDVGKPSAPAAQSVVQTTEPDSTQQPQRYQKSFWQSFVNAQKQLRESLSQQILQLKAGNWGSIFKFLLICFVYGLIHALGPGHGKSIVIGYFIARKGKWWQGVSLGAGITVTHTLSAVVLLLVLYLIFKATVFTAFETGRIGIEKASYILIMVTGLLLVGMGVRDFVTRKKKHPDEMAVSPSASVKEIIGVSAITGIVPCPAVALVVLFCLLNSMVALALLGALVICIGMTITNVSFGLAAVAFRKGIDSKSVASRFALPIYSTLTVAGGVIIAASGLLLWLNQYAGRV